MSTQLERAGIQLYEGYDREQLDPAPDLVVVGNALSRGNPAVEAVLDRGIPYVSGPQWLGEQLLADKWVLAVSGTHGKTTTTSILAWLLDYARHEAGFPRGAVCQRILVFPHALGSRIFLLLKPTNTIRRSLISALSLFITAREHWYWVILNLIMGIFSQTLPPLSASFIS